MYLVEIDHGGVIILEYYDTYKEAFLRYCFWEDAMLDKVGQISSCFKLTKDNEILILERI